MLVKFNERKFLVTGFFIRKDESVDYLSLIDVETGKEESANFADVSIIDGRFPPNFSMKRHVYPDGAISFIFSIDNEFTDENFWDKYEEDDPEAMKIYYDFLDSLTDLHGLPRIKHPEIIDSDEDTKPSEEQRRLQRLEEELNSYLDSEDQDKNP